MRRKDGLRMLDHCAKTVPRFSPAHSRRPLSALTAKDMSLFWNCDHSSPGAVVVSPGQAGGSWGGRCSLTLTPRRLKKLIRFGYVQ